MRVAVRVGLWGRVGDEEDVLGSEPRGWSSVRRRGGCGGGVREDCVFLIDGDTDADGIGDDAAIDGVDAGDDGVGEGYLLECGSFRTARAVERRMARTRSGSAEASTERVREATAKSRETLETVAIWELGM